MEDLLIVIKKKTCKLQLGDVVDVNTNISLRLKKKQQIKFAQNVLCSTEWLHQQDEN